MKWKYHLTQLGYDLVWGLAVYLAPIVNADDFTWTRQWWLIVLGGLARRAIMILLGYIKRVLGNRTPSE